MFRVITAQVFPWRFTSSSNCFVVSRMSSGGGSAAVASAFATFDTQPPEEVVGVGAFGQVFASLGIAQGLSGDGICDPGRAGDRPSLLVFAVSGLAVVAKGKGSSK